MSTHRFIGFVVLVGMFIVADSTFAAVIEVTGVDSAAVKAGLDKAAVGDTVQLPEGTIELSEAIQPKSGIKLLGRGIGKTTVIYKGTAPTVLMAINNCEDVEVAQMTLDGQNNPQIHQGIGSGNSKRLWLHDLAIRNLKSKTFGPHGIIFSGSNPTMEGGVTDSRITDCQFTDIGLDAEYGGAIRLAWGSSRNLVQNNTIKGTGRGGIFGDHSPELIIRQNKVSGSGGAGLGIEIWGGCPRSVIEDNTIDHWLSVDAGDQSAVRRNTIGTDDGTLKGFGIEIIATNVVVTDNVVQKGTQTGLSVSNKPAKTNVFWSNNTVRQCIQWGAQLQGDEGGVARHYFYRCQFLDTVRGDPRASYPNDSGHGFRTNGNCKDLVFEACEFTGNGGLGLQLGGPSVDALSFQRCTIKGNGSLAIAGPDAYTALEFVGCKVLGNQNNQLPKAKPFPKPAPTARFTAPETALAGTEVSFACTSQSAKGDIAERLWDFGDGFPETTSAAKHTFAKAGTYRVTLIVWDKNGRAGRAEKMIKVTEPK